jgi:acetoin utilization protein AcuB
MVVREIMTRDVTTVTPESSIGTAIQRMKAGGFRRLPVVENGRLVGIVTDRDLRLATNSPLVLHEKWYSEFILETVKVKSCMTSNPITVTPEAPVLAAARLLRQHKIGGLPVVDADQLVGIVTTTDVLDLAITLLEKMEE